MALISRALVKVHLGISAGDTSQDELLDQLIAQADAIIKGELQRDIEQATYTEFHAGTGDRELILRNYPVQSITSLYCDPGAYYGEASGAFAASTLLVAGTDYALLRDANSTGTIQSKTGIVMRLNGAWPAMSQGGSGLLSSGIVNGIGNIKITYVAGYPSGSVPKGIEWAGLQLVSEMNRTRKFGGAVSQESYDYYAVTFANAAENSELMSGIRRSLAPHKRRFM